MQKLPKASTVNISKYALPYSEPVGPSKLALQPEGRLVESCPVIIIFVNVVKAKEILVWFQSYL